jgi:hypothetical protein
MSCATSTVRRTTRRAVLMDETTKERTNGMNGEMNK